MIEGHEVGVKWSREDSCWIAEALDLPFVAAHGDTLDEAIRQLEICIQGIAEERNREAFRRNVDRLFDRHPWKYAIFHEARLAGIAPDQATALRYARTKPGALARQIVRASMTHRGRPCFTMEDAAKMDCPWEPYPELR